jgi:hypothetical protein
MAVPCERLPRRSRDAFFERVRARRGTQVAVVATARKLAVLCWHLVTPGEDYAFQRPSLTEKKLRALELRAGMPSRRGQKGKAAAYSLKELRRRENELAEQAEQARGPRRRRCLAARRGIPGAERRSSRRAERTHLPWSAHLSELGTAAASALARGHVSEVRGLSAASRQARRGRALFASARARRAVRALSEPPRIVRVPVRRPFRLRASG